MAFAVKDWQSAPSTATPISASALEDLETRLSNYTDSRSSEVDVSVATYGAVGNDLTDDKAAIQAAINATPAGGRVACVPGKIYRISGALTFPVDNVTFDMQGAGIRAGASVSGQLAAKGAYFYVDARSGIRIKSGRILTPAAPFAPSEFFGGRIFLNLCNRCVADHIYCSDDGSAAVYTDYGVGATSGDNEFSDSDCVATAAAIISSSRGRILRNRFQTSPYNGISVIGYNTEPANEAHIEGNMIYSMGRIGVEVYSQDGTQWIAGARVKNNHIESPAVATGYQSLSVMGNAAEISGNELLQNGAAWGVECSGNGTKIQNNRIKNAVRVAGSQGIYMITTTEDEAGGIISGNTIHNFDGGINVLGGGYPTPEPVVVVGNNITDPLGTAISVESGHIIGNNSIRFGKQPAVAGGHQGIACNDGCILVGNRIKILAGSYRSGVTMIVLRLEGNNITLGNNTIDRGTRVDADFFLTYASTGYTGWSMAGNNVINPAGSLGRQGHGKATLDPAGVVYSQKAYLGKTSYDGVSTGPLATLAISPLADGDYGLAIQKRASQTGPLLVIDDSGAFPANFGVVVDSSLRLGVGIDPATLTAKINAGVTETGANLVAAPAMACVLTLNSTGGVVTDYAGALSGKLTVNPTTATTLTAGVDGYNAVSGLVQKLNAGTVDSVACLQAGLQVYQGTIGDYDALRLPGPYDGSGGSATITNTFGVRIKQQKFGASNSWGIYQESTLDRNYFNGNIGIGAASPANRLVVNTPATADALAQAIIHTGVATNKGVVIQGFASQSANLEEWQSSTGTVLSRISSTGSLVTNNATSPNVLINPSADVISLIIKTFAGSTSNQQEWQDSTGAIKARISASGSIVSSGRIIGGTLSVLTNVTHQFYGAVATDVAMVIRGFASQSANLTEWQDSTGTVVGRVASSGIGVFFAGLLGGINSGSANVSNIMGATVATSVGLVVKGFASQSAALQEWRDSSDVVLTRIVAAGQLSTPGIRDMAATGAILDMGSSSINIGTRTNTNIGVIIKGVASQSGNLTQWQDSGGVILTAIQSDGKLVFGPSGSQDANLYRSTTATLKTDANFIVAGPTGTQTFATIGGNMTNTSSGAAIGIAASTGINPAGTSQTEFRSISMSAAVQVGNAQNFTGGGSAIKGGYFETRWHGSGSADALYGIHTRVILPTAAVNFGTIALAVGLYSEITEAGSGPITGTITTAASILAGNISRTGITYGTAIGVDVAGQTVATTNIGVRIAKSNTYSLQLSSTAGDAASGITWGTDTNLYRGAANLLQTDDTLQVQAPAIGNNGIIIKQFSGSQTAALLVCATSAGAQLAAIELGGQFTTKVSGSGTTSGSYYATPSAATDFVFGCGTQANTRQAFIIDAAGKHQWGSGAIAPDVTLYRLTTDQLKTDDMMIAALGIGVGNSAAATTLGTVVKKMQVFDASGASLGYVAIYDAIT